MKMIHVPARLVTEQMVELTEAQVRDLAIKLICEKYDLLARSYIKDGKLMYDQEIGMGSHSTFDERVIRDATPADQAALDVIHTLLVD